MYQLNLKKKTLNLTKQKIKSSLILIKAKSPLGVSIRSTEILKTFSDFFFHKPTNYKFL